MDKMKEFIEKIKKSWNELDKKKKIAMIIVLVGIVILVSIFSIMSRRVDYLMLYKDLSLEDAAKIVNDLDSKDIKYKLEDGGTSILIDSKKMDKYRLDLAMDGNLPRDIAGYEIFDDVGMMVTDEDRKIMYQRALEGELEKSINSIDAIKHSKVHLVISEESIFESEKKEASASVVLDLKPNAKLNENNLRGIASLVSGAVKDLPMTNIKIIDASGNLLSDGFDEDTGGSSAGVNSYQDIKLEHEKNLEGNVLKLLEPILGSGKVNVVVNADLDFDSIETTKTTYSDPVVRSEQLNVNGNDIRTQDDGNIGYTASNVINEVDGEDASYNRTVNNELTTEVTNTKQTPGKVKKITVSVVYDGELSRQKTQQIEDIVGTAIGYDFDREDLINVIGMEFDRSDLEGLADADEDDLSGLKKLLSGKARVPVLVGAVLLTILLVFLLVRRILKGRREEEEDLDFEDEVRVVRQTPIGDILDDDTTGASKDEEEERVKKYCQENPEMVADLMKAWMKEE